MKTEPKPEKILHSRPQGMRACAKEFTLLPFSRSSIGEGVLRTVHTPNALRAGNSKVMDSIS